jgi:hypothetical protein
MLAELQAALDAIAADAAVRVVVIAGPARPSAPATTSRRCAPTKQGVLRRSCSSSAAADDDDHPKCRSR